MKTNLNIRQQSSRLLLAFAILCLVLAGCSKKDDPAPTPTTKTGLLTQNTWKVTAYTSTDALSQSLGVLIIGSEYTFKSDGTLTYTVLGISGGTGKWEFANSETHIIFNKGTSDENDSEIVTLDNTNLELKQVIGTVTNTTKYTKK